MTDITDSALAAINMFQDHSSMENIRAKNFKSVFSLTHTYYTYYKRHERNCDCDKTCQLKDNEDIPTKIIKMNADIFI